MDIIYILHRTKDMYKMFTAKLCTMIKNLKNQILIIYNITYVINYYTAKLRNIDRYNINECHNEMLTNEFRSLYMQRKIRAVETKPTLAAHGNSNL